MTDLPPEARNLFDAARADLTPSAEDLAVVRRGLSVALGASVLAPSAAAAKGLAANAASVSKGAVAKGVLAKVVGGWGVGHTVGTLLIASAAGTGAIMLGTGEGARDATRNHTTPGARTVTESRGNGTDPSGSNVARRGQPPSRGRAKPSPSASQVIPLEDLPFESTVSDEPERNVLPQRAEPPLGEAKTESGTDPASIRLDEKRREPSKYARSGDRPDESESRPGERGALPDPGSGHASTLGQEIELIREARAALSRGEPAETLTLVSEHEARYSGGTLGEEALSLRSLALCALNRPDAARAVRAQLERIAPNSPHLERLKQSCASD